MPYVDGYVAAVPTASREAYRDYSARIADLFRAHGATRVVDCWGDEVPEGTLTSFPKAVQRKEDETVIFGWVEWPSREARAAAWDKLMAAPEMDLSRNPLPFDGRRMIYGAFETIVDA